MIKLSLSASAILVSGLVLMLLSVVLGRFTEVPSFISGFIIGLGIVLLIGGIAMTTLSRSRSSG